MPSFGSSLFRYGLGVDGFPSVELTDRCRFAAKSTPVFGFEELTPQKPKPCTLPGNAGGFAVAVDVVVDVDVDVDRNQILTGISPDYITQLESALASRHRSFSVLRRVLNSASTGYIARSSHRGEFWMIYIAMQHVTWDPNP